MNEQETLQAALADPGVKLLMGKFNAKADELPLLAIQALLADDIPKAKRCAYLWDTYKNEIPRISQNIINRGEPEKPWSFFNWLFNK